MAELNITKANFEEIVKKADKPVLIDFWATWCGPCRMQGPVIRDIAEEYEGKLVVGKVNVDEEPELASAFGIVSIPTLVLIKDGAIAKQLVGLHTKAQLIAEL